MRLTLCLAAAGLYLVLANVSCSLRATTDFGPQSGSSTRTISAGPAGFPGVTATDGPDARSLGLGRERPDHAGDPSRDADPLDASGNH